MIKKVTSNPAAGLHKFNRQPENKTRNANRHFNMNIADRIEISKEARAASREKKCVLDSPDETIKQILEEYNNTSGLGRIGKTEDDSSNDEQKKRLAAIKIAMRIANGDNVPIDDHKWLAEYDSKLYMAALKASLTADNDDPKDYDSLIAEMFAEQNPAADAASDDLELDAVEITEELVDAPIDSVDVYY